jgi:hypothetical protein
MLQRTEQNDDKLLCNDLTVLEDACREVYTSDIIIYRGGSTRNNGGGTCQSVMKQYYYNNNKSSTHYILDSTYHACPNVISKLAFKCSV